MGDGLLSREYADGLKGWMCIGVLAHHMAQFSGLFSNTYFGHFLQLLGAWAVAVFLFLSGYGLCYSYGTKGQDYLHGFLKKRFLPLYAIYALAVLLYFLYDFSNGMTIGKVLRSLTWGGTIVSFGWFFQLLFAAYLAFFLVFRYCRGKYARSAAFGIFLLAYLFLAHCFGQSGTPILSFACGMLFAVHKKGCASFFGKHTLGILLFSFCTFFAVYMIYVQGTIMGKFRMNAFVWAALSTISDLAIIWFALSVSILCEKHKIPLITNPFTAWWKKYSLEIYILQGLTLRMLYPYFTNAVLYLLCCFVCLLFLAILFHRITSLFLSLGRA